MTVFRFLFLCVCLLPAVAQQPGVAVKFDPSNPVVGPFPTDALTIPDATQKTGRTINLPLPDCSIEVSECGVISALNQLDGFNLRPRLLVKFTGPIDPSTLKNGVFLVSLDNLTNEEVGQSPAGQTIAINQIIYDPDTKTAYAAPDSPLDQHRRFALITTDAIRDSTGAPVQADPTFTACVQSPTSDSCNSLSTTLGSLQGLPSGNIIAASTFTTMSATAWLEQARDLLPQVPPQYTSSGPPINASSIVSITTKDTPKGARQLGLPAFAADGFRGVDRIVFGTFQSPNFLNDQQYVPESATASTLALPVANNTLLVHAYIPSSPMPPAGYPVVIQGHATGENSFISPSLVAPAYARAGYVTLAINAVGHGYGPDSVIEVAQTGNVVTTFTGGGRGVDLNGDGVVDRFEGCFLEWPYPIVGRDCIRQTTVDLIQLVNLVSSGVSIDPSSNLQLDASRIYYAGVSLGAIYGTALHAVDPRVRAAVPNSGGGPLNDILRLSNSTLHNIAIDLVNNRTPSLLDHRAYNDNWVARDQAPVVNDVPGAIAIQNMYGELDWLQASGDPINYTPHIIRSPLAGNSPKPVLFQYAQGDLTVPNVTATELIRYAGPAASSTFYRTDLARIAAQTIGETIAPGYDPHEFLADVLTNRTTAIVAAAAQSQIVGFFNSDGATIPDPNKVAQQLFPAPLSAPLFEIVIGHK